MFTKLQNLTKRLFQQMFSKVENYSDFDKFFNEAIQSDCDWVFGGFNSDFEYPSLSQSQIQYLIDRNKKELTHMYGWVHGMRATAKILWAGSDKNTPEGQDYFSQLNTYRDLIKIHKQEIKKLSEIQTVLKKMRSLV